MSLDIKVPASGESITSANIGRWHVASGSSVKKGDVIVTLETDKVSNELDSPADGVLEIITPEGEEVGIGAVIARLVASAATAPEVTPVAAPSTAGIPAASGAKIDLKVPASGESITSASIGKWHKNHGDAVTQGEVLVTLETDKVSNELEAPVSGTLSIISAVGEEVAIGHVIGQITEGAASLPSAPAAPVSAPAPSAIVAAQSAAAQVVSAPAAPAVALTPNVAALAAAKTPSASASTPSAAAVTEGRTTRKKMSMLRRKIATHLVNAQQTAAILTTFNEVDMTAVMELRKQVQDEFVKKYGTKLGFMSFFVKAVTQALKDVPQINARIEGQEIIENHFYDIGVAIGTEKGLVVPVLRDADQKSFAQIEKDIIGYANKAKDGKITIEDLQGGVFTISNGGTYGSLLSTPILNPPQSGILGMHTIQQRPVALDGQVVIRPMMYLALSYDHRLVDGKEAVTFLIRIKECLENPSRLLLEM